MSTLIKTRNIKSLFRELLNDMKIPLGVRIKSMEQYNHSFRWLLLSRVKESCKIYGTVINPTRICYRKFDEILNRKFQTLARCRCTTRLILLLSEYVGMRKFWLFYLLLFFHFLFLFIYIHAFIL